MRVALINEGGYPYRVATAGTWCHRLVAGLDEHDFHLVTIVDATLRRTYPVLTNNPSLTPVPLTGRSVHLVGDTIVVAADISPSGAGRSLGTQASGDLAQHRGLAERGGRPGRRKPAWPRRLCPGWPALAADSLLGLPCPAGDIICG